MRRVKNEPLAFWSTSTMLYTSSRADLLAKPTQSHLASPLIGSKCMTNYTRLRIVSSSTLGTTKRVTKRLICAEATRSLRSGRIRRCCPLLFGIPRSKWFSRHTGLTRANMSTWTLSHTPRSSRGRLLSTESVEWIRGRRTYHNLATTIRRVPTIKLITRKCTTPSEWITRLREKI